MDYEVVIGLEVHVHLKTESKMFCSCSTEFGAEPNTHTCPVCQGMPGVLPVMNRKAIELALKSALALNCKVMPKSVFSRKNYFYPDLPKNYQISQYDMPLAERGWLDIPGKKISIKRVHLEEDAGKLVHSGEGIEGSVYSLVDLNRTGVPLLEIVTDPDIESPEQALRYLTNLKQILQYIDISDCDMEQGKLRCDANISLRKKGGELGVKTELKNMNSFKAVQAGLEGEIKRQARILGEGGTIIQETRLWDEKKGETYSMRSKEEAHDYRYFPEPDLVPVEPDGTWITAIRESMQELPAARMQRFIKDYNLSEYDAGVLTTTPAASGYFDECIKERNRMGLLVISPKEFSNWITGPLFNKIDVKNKSVEEIKELIPPINFVGLTQAIIVDKLISPNLGKEEVFPDMIGTNKTAFEIIKEKGLEQINDDKQIINIVEKIIKENSKVVQDYKSGNEKVLGFLIGQIIKETKGKANPQIVNKILKEKLK
ncbi:Asp-tRNA(Asn)/Glu-tRNA(Gln) amidotransferase GatCAB subunit B [Candidatus Desantisbacteria bacterium CG02_land_8_20_14_3_00_49_13]|nr:MAG: Asp-tRNA(Asn)/Glu-tRNA(Gln) amidotransferase GatCAB subunit B [Candidatus Desantisbacteria bacterium CG02_land_8_20_14_3_00_49_13]